MWLCLLMNAKSLTGTGSSSQMASPNGAVGKFSFSSL